MRLVFSDLDYVESDDSNVDLFKPRVRSSSDQVMGRLVRHVSDPCLVSCRVRLARASLFGMSSRILTLCRVSFGSKIMICIWSVDCYR